VNPWNLWTDPLAVCCRKLRPLSHIPVTLIEVRGPVMTERLRRDSIVTGTANSLSAAGEEFVR